jgi:4-diphosphocytidyl-2C-methyl-D-erythritol kinase
VTAEERHVVRIVRMVVWRTRRRVLKWVVLLPGPEPVPTAAVYRALEARGVDGGTDDAIYQWTIAGGELPLAACVNELQPVVVAGWPEVGNRLAAIRETAPLRGQVSGSGGTVFALFATRDAAERAAQALVPYRALLAPVLGREQAQPRPSAPEA